MSADASATLASGNLKGGTVLRLVFAVTGQPRKNSAICKSRGIFGLRGKVLPPMSYPGPDNKEADLRKRPAGEVKPRSQSARIDNSCELISGGLYSSGIFGL
ncbi:MAG: hypothetical protein M1819_002802 [Sarea resinae]|nr:MAG: hypothetical protein M1819_002802 [Sarea resinae]